jgi:hypothetical protein
LSEAKKRSTEASSVTSMTPWATPPRVLAAACSLSAERDAIVTAAPAARAALAVAKPMPELPPTTRTWRA